MERHIGVLETSLGMEAKGQNFSLSSVINWGYNLDQFTLVSRIILFWWIGH